MRQCNDAGSFETEEGISCDLAISSIKLRYNLTISDKDTQASNIQHP